MDTFAVKNCSLHGLSTFIPLPAPSLSLFGTNMCKVLSSSRKGSVGLSVSEKKLTKVKNCAVESKQEALLQTRMGNWEDPDDGSASECDDEDEDEQMEDNDLDFESDWEEERGNKSATTNKYEEDLVNGIWFCFICLV